jgi:hypothetical protein
VEAYENSQDELAYWLKQLKSGKSPASADANGAHGNEDDLLLQLVQPKLESKPPATEKVQLNASDPNETSESHAAHHQQQLHAQIGAMENKIRRLRAAIADLSEENARNLQAVDQRGLSGGVQLVRTLREEIRDVEYLHAETLAAEAACRAKIRLVQVKVKASDHTAEGSKGDSGSDYPNQSTLVQDRQSVVDEVDYGRRRNVDGSGTTPTSIDSQGNREADLPDSERIARGQSTALVVRGAKGSRGFLPFTIWQILLRIMGMRDHHRDHVGNPAASTTAPVMII